MFKQFDYDSQEFRAFRTAFNMQAGGIVDIDTDRRCWREVRRAYRVAVRNGLLEHNPPPGNLKAIDQTVLLKSSPHAVGEIGDGKFLELVQKMVDWFADPANQAKLQAILKFVVSIIAVFTLFFALFFWPTTAHAEIKVTTAKAVSITGFPNAEISGNQIVLSGEGEYTLNLQPAARIKVVADVKWLLVTVQRVDLLPNGNEALSVEKKTLMPVPLRGNDVESGPAEANAAKVTCYVFADEPGIYQIEFIGFDPGLQYTSTRVTLGKVEPLPEPDDPPEPDDSVVVPNEYGLGAVAYKFAPRNDANQLKAMAITYRAASDFLYGKPKLKFIDAPAHPKSTDPEHNVLAWLHQELAAARVSEGFINEVDKALVKSQKDRKFYQREDWYLAFKEIAAALDAVQVK